MAKLQSGVKHFGPIFCYNRNVFLNLGKVAQLIFTCLKLTMESLEKVVIYVQS